MQPAITNWNNEFHQNEYIVNLNFKEKINWLASALVIKFNIDLPIWLNLTHNIQVHTDTHTSFTWYLVNSWFYVTKP